MTDIGDGSQLRRAATLPHVQFRKTCNGGRLNNSSCGSHGCLVSRMVDAADICLVSPPLFREKNVLTAR